MAGIVRPERQDDIDAIRQVHRAAFGRAAEARLVDALRASGKLLISLVMDCEGKIAGHIAFSPVNINEETIGVGLAPLSMLPRFQRQGVGSRLVRAGLAECRRGRVRLVVVLGEPAYYGRFGFVPATRMKLTNEYGAGEEFMALSLEPASTPLNGGLVRYAPEFGLVT